MSGKRVEKLIIKVVLHRGKKCYENNKEVLIEK